MDIFERIEEFKNIKGLKYTDLAKKIETVGVDTIRKGIKHKNLKINHIIDICNVYRIPYKLDNSNEYGIVPARTFMDNTSTEKNIDLNEIYGGGYLGVSEMNEEELTVFFMRLKHYYHQYSKDERWSLFEQILRKSERDDIINTILLKK